MEFTSSLGKRLRPIVYICLDWTTKSVHGNGVPSSEYGDIETIHHDKDSLPACSALYSRLMKVSRGL